MIKAAVFLALAALAALFSGPARAADSAAVFVYHRFGEAAFPATNVTLAQFEAQIAEIETGGYAPLAIPEILAALEGGSGLPDRTVGFSADDAYLSVFTEAWPRLKAAGIPLTVFVATDAVDRGFPNFMSWDQIRELARQGVTIGSHGAAHVHMADATPEAARAEIARANARFKAELGFVPEIFSYPYGEASRTLETVAKEAGFKFAFGQYSGIITRESDFLYLPRFAVNEHFGGIAAFTLRARALGLPVRDLDPADPLLHTPPKTISFTPAAGIGGLDHLACFAADGHPFPVSVNGERVTLLLDRTPPPGEFRIGCTLPTAQGRFRWFGTAYYLSGK